MRSRLNSLLFGAGVAVVLSSFLSGLPTALAQRGESATPPLPTPRLAGGTPNLGRIQGELGVWRVPYIMNIADRIVSVGGVPIKREAAAARAPADALSATREREPRGGSRSEPHMPFMPWSAAVYDYHTTNESKYDPEGYCCRRAGRG